MLKMTTYFYFLETVSSAQQSIGFLSLNDPRPSLLLFLQELTALKMCLNYVHQWNRLTFYYLVGFCISGTTRQRSCWISLYMQVSIVGALVLTEWLQDLYRKCHNGQRLAASGLIGMDQFATWWPNTARLFYRFGQFVCPWTHETSKSIWYG